MFTLYRHTEIQTPGSNLQLDTALKPNSKHELHVASILCHTLQTKYLDKNCILHENTTISSATSFIPNFIKIRPAVLLLKHEGGKAGD